MTQRPLALGDDREAALAHAAELVMRAWRGFDHAREEEHVPDPTLRQRLAISLPEEGMDVLAGLDLAAEVLDTSLAQARPRYLAYIGSSGLEIGAMADLLAHSYDVNMALDARAASLVEEQAARWLGAFVGYPVASGWFTSGGTISNITALAAARERAMPGVRHDGIGARRGAVYCSMEVHYSVRRAVELLGLGSSWLRAIPIDHRRRMSIPALREAIAADIAEGIAPVAVVATGGTTLTGAVDPLNAIADVCADHHVWMHVDGAYGLPAAGVGLTKDQFAGLDRADSISIDAHKWLFVPKACSAVLVRDPSALVSAFGHHEAYIPHEDDTLNAVDATLEYSRPLRALKLWLAFTVHGAGEFRAAIEGNLRQARLLHALAAVDPDFDVLPEPPTLSIAPIRHVPKSLRQDASVDADGHVDEDNIDRHNDALCAAIQDDGRVYLSKATIDGRTWLRPCFTNFRTTQDDVQQVMDVVRELGARLST
jgi:aromatic-L-amino-acid/L-tryptophan decarboxylase